jgi:hypothetical protein
MTISNPTREANPWKTPLRDLGLRIDGTPLAPIVLAFQDELAQRGITGVAPHFYLSTEWGVPFGSVSIAIPFYLARPDLTELHASRGGLVEGTDADDVRRYLRHEMGHVFNYAYRLHAEPEWTRLFGDIDQPYEEEYRPRPFSRDYVWHLPGWYAQKHPDEDWAETFAVWLTPGLDWRHEYSGAPVALAKLEYCDRTVERLKAVRAPLVIHDSDEDVNALSTSLEQLYRELAPGDPELSEPLRQALRDMVVPLGRGRARPVPLGELLRALDRTLPPEVYRWTGEFPERTRLLMGRLAAQADRDQLTYPAEREREAAVAISVLLTALAMNHVVRGAYLP